MMSAYSIPPAMQVRPMVAPHAAAPFQTPLVLANAPLTLAETAIPLAGMMMAQHQLKANQATASHSPKEKSALAKLAEANLDWSERMDRTRLVGYLNEAAQGLIHIVGQPFKTTMDRVVYGFSALYALSKGVQAYDNANPEESKKLKLARAASATAYGGLFQLAASCEGPVWGVKAVQFMTRKIANAMGHTVPAQIAKFEMIAGLASIPLMVKPIDTATRWILDRTLKPLSDVAIGLLEKMEQNQRLQVASAPASQALEPVRFESFA
ncbi:MAG: hypothetical protein VKK59_02465 [Vampirovibrionales bacterium]|nr:hypothetical protein [Vampirovibrionales bacterium]